jgi:hypothetical protein
MSTASDLSSGHPLSKCGVPARLRNSWTTSNPAKKWYGCNNYKVISEISLISCKFGNYAINRHLCYRWGVLKRCLISELDWSLVVLLIWISRFVDLQ